MFVATNRVGMTFGRRVPGKSPIPHSECLLLWHVEHTNFERTDHIQATTAHTHKWGIGGSWWGT